MTDKTVNEQLVRLLYTYAPATLLASFALLSIVLAALWGHVDEQALLLWGTTLTVLTVTRMVLVVAWQKKETVFTSHAWGNYYTAGSFLSGIGWSSLILFYSASLPTLIQLFILVVLVALPIAGMPGNAIYVRAYYVFSMPVLVTLIYWSLFEAEYLTWQFGGAAAAYLILITVTAHAFHSNLLGALEIGLKNQRLAEELEISNKQLEKMAYYDPLTGLANRRWFQEQTENALVRSRRHRKKMALLLLDLDNFKSINDELGHDAGDELLKTVAERLSHCLRQSDMVAREVSQAARYGGDEFVILLEDIGNREDVEQTANRMLEIVSTPMPIGDITWVSTVSIGIALYPDHAEDLTTLMRQADNAMYRAKQGGRNQLHIVKASA